MRWPGNTPQCRCFNLNSVAGPDPWPHYRPSSAHMGPYLSKLSREAKERNILEVCSWKAKASESCIQGYWTSRNILVETFVLSILQDFHHGNRGGHSLRNTPTHEAQYSRVS